MNLIKAIYNDFKTDIQFLSKVAKGEYKCPYTLKELIDIRPMLKDKQTWMFFMIIVAALLTGMFISAKHYQLIANEELIKAHEFVDSHCMGYTKEYYENIPKFDFSEVISEMNNTGVST